MQANLEVAIKAVSLNGLALQYCSPELRNSKTVVSAALNQAAYALRNASDEMKANRQMVLQAVSLDGKMLVHAHPSLREDDEVVLAAVQQNGAALSYASEELRARGDLVRAAVENNGMALRYACPELRGSTFTAKQSAQDVSISRRLIDSSTQAICRRCLRYLDGF